MANATAALSKLVLDHLFGNAAWAMPTSVQFALYTNAAATVEVAGGTYARQTLAVPLVGAGAQQTANTAGVNFTSMPACSVAAVGVLTTAGVLLLVMAYATPIAVPLGATVAYAAGQIVVIAS